MRTFKKAKVVMLSTNEKSLNSVFSLRSDKPYLMSEQNSPFTARIYDTKDLYHTYFNLYIISDDEIKEGDWYYCKRLNKIFQAIKGITYNIEGNEHKIIATTDTSLYREESCTGYTETRSRTFYSKKPLPQPSQQFIQKFVEEYNKGREIKEVLVEYDVHKNSFIPLWIPKVNPKDNTITIKKVKDNWTREEHISNIKKFSLELGSKIHCFLKEDGTLSISIQDVNKWIEENL